jgi:glycosyltransferase involved in cell wall biosynthesis
LTVIVPAHNPDTGRLRRVLSGLGAQTLPAAEREILVVDSASHPPLAQEKTVEIPVGTRIVREETLGLTVARLRGFAEARGELFALVDDDNVLAPDYLEAACRCFEDNPRLGAAGGRCLPEFESPPPVWMREFDGLLALRNPGDIPQEASWEAAASRIYPLCAPVGAGMILRRTAAERYAAALAADPRRRAFDRAGQRLVSGGDNDLVMTMLEAGYAVAYRPELSLTHLIPARRIRRSYLGSLNRAIARSWVGVLALHGIAPWPAISRGTVRIRQARAWLRAGAWRGPAEWVRWQGLCGMLEGRADLCANPRASG